MSEQRPRPQLILLSGPNGAGKTTAAPNLLKGALGVTEFVNADTIAQGLSAFRPEGTSFEAGRVMLRRLRQLANARADFAFESTLASRSFAPWIRGLKESGYAFHLLFLWLPSATVAKARVAARVRLGGHDVPDEIIRRRYFRGIRNFFKVYRPLATTWRMYDNSGSTRPRLIAWGEDDDLLEVNDAEIWGRITQAPRRAQ